MKEIFIEKPEEVRIIHPRAYSNMPIVDLINIVGDPDNILSLEESEMLIADIVVKYLVMYLLGTPKDQIVPLEDVNYFYGWMCAWSKNLREHGKCKIGIPKEITPFLQSFSSVAHTAVMVSDIASTTAIIRDMVMATVEKNKNFSDTYVGLDIGTGSGILMIGMKMQAMRNKYNNILMFGVENNRESINRAEQVMRKIDRRQTSFLFGDSTKPDTYHQIYKEQLAPHFICNETLPQQGAPFYVPGYPAEPFFQNHAAIQEVGIHRASTKYFPHSVEVEMAHGEQSCRMTLGPNNNFKSDIIGRLDEECYALFSPQNVQNTEISALKPLREIGDELREKTWDSNNSRRIIPANPGMRFRWTSPKSLDKNFELPVT